MDISERKLAANQQNARRSTGPRTLNGKAKVRYNALKHGLLAKEVIVPLGDEHKKRMDFAHLLVDLCTHYAPVDPIEAMLVEKIAVAYWRLRRATRAEVGELIVEIDEIDKIPGFETEPCWSGVATILLKQVMAADSNFDFATWLQNEKEVLAELHLDWKEVSAHMNNLPSDQRKPWLLQALKEQQQKCSELERAQIVLRHRVNWARRVQRSLSCIERGPGQDPQI